MPGDSMNNYLGIGVLVLGIGLGAVGVGSYVVSNQYSAKLIPPPASNPVKAQPASQDLSSLESRLSDMDRTVKAMATQTADYWRKDDAHYQRTYKIQQGVEALEEKAGISYSPTPTSTRPASAPKPSPTPSRR